jgi:alkaline phosphatase D
VAPAATKDRQAVSRIAFGSCAHQERPQPIWDQVSEAKPDVLLLIGDNIYGDTRDMAALQKKYELASAVPGLKKLRGRVPTFGTWDDHDFGENDAGGDFPHKRESQQLFLDFFNVPSDSPQRTQEGVYSAQTFGPVGKRVQIILLDTRYFRSRWKSNKPTTASDRRPYAPDDNPAATMLGEAQWTWLGEQLRQPANLRLLVSSIQVITESGGGEKWMNFPHERERLFALLRDTKAGGVVILSGDRHFADLSMMNAGLGYPLYDLTSSGLTQGAEQWRPLQPNPHRVAGMAWGDNFGLITVDWTEADPTVRLQVRDGDGDIRINEKFPLSTLRRPAPATTTATSPAAR